MNTRLRRAASTLSLLSAALAVAACATNSPTPRALQVAGQQMTAISESQSVIEASSCSKARCIYVANPSTGQGDTVNVYAATATGNRAPVEFISGQATGLSTPYGVAVDASHKVYVANLGDSVVTVYAAGAHGDVKPIRTISGSFTGLAEPVAIAVSDDGKIYVANAVGDNAPASITVYAPGANGNVPPTQVINGSNTGLSGPGGITLDASARIYVTGNGAISVFAANARGNVAPIRIIKGSSTGLIIPTGIGLDAQSNIYVANGGNGGPSSITVYAAHANGNATPIRTITGPDTGMAGADGLALDAHGKTYISNNDGGGSNASIAVYAAGANGNTPPIQAIVGTKTKLQSPRGIAVR